MAHMTEWWQVPAGGRLSWAQWGDYASVFSSLSGETYLLSALPAEALYLIAEAPTAWESACAVLAERCETDDSAAWQAKLRATLQDLAALDLIERRTP